MAHDDVLDMSRLSSMAEATEVVLMVDKDDNEVGTCTRKEMRQFNKWHRTTCTVLLSTRGSEVEVIYHKRSSQKVYCPSYNDLAFGGVVTVGESYVDNALRETSEESGLSVSEENLYELGNYARDEECIRCHYKLFVALYNGPLDRLTPQPGEVDEIRSTPLSTIDELMKAEKFTSSCSWIIPRIKEFVKEGGISKLKEVSI
ncbi:hydrolase, NUDIX family protein, putative [Babesia bigemina]|uniref:Hydrolase, NUDIX family protein, putative n=1 Tax=Babesia bigemina TaxID=5866 RepID=A0A061D715_BABBI|nr:hydrolase, NUDIX family protein, putative [Babesia bigemina]CDR96298.1 hydrolase, NUDIX family protein, putative [Babesia bigemina]|eukprot:XP_012768484.1 hydrolase, NUDIX family protein, putative [Babesia bigemina]